MKYQKILAIVLILFSVLSLSACGATNNASNSSNPISTDASAEQGLNNILEDYNGNVSVDSENPSDSVTSIIRELNSSFQPDDYNIDVYNHNEEKVTIDYTRVIGAFVTNIGFTAIVNSGQLTSLYDHTKEISDEEIANLCALSDRLGVSFQPEAERTVPIQPVNGEERPSEPKELAEALQLALEQTQASPEKEAKQQRYYYYYDVESEKASILVYTEYYLDETEATSVDLYTYPLE